MSRVRIQSLFGWAGMTLSVAGLILIVFAFVHPIEAHAWDPLTGYTEQKVTSPQPIHLNQTVNVTGTKCAKETVSVLGSKSWQQNGGILVPNGYGTGTRTKGCVTKTFENIIPVEVADYVRQHGASQWFILGVETPVRGNGQQGVPHVWRTGPFTLEP